MAQSTKKDKASVDYHEAIEHAEIKPESDRRLELRGCVKNWDALSTDRTGLFDGSPSKAGSVTLEVGNSGFPRYDYVRVDGFLLSSSYSSATVDVSKSSLGKKLSKLYASSLADLYGSADAEVDDGDCYYLTVNGNAGKRSVAIYGYPGSTQSGILVKELLDAAEGHDY
jgi:hypothetical protein